MSEQEETKYNGIYNSIEDFSEYLKKVFLRNYNFFNERDAQKFFDSANNLEEINPIIIINKEISNIYTVIAIYPGMEENPTQYNFINGNVYAYLLGQTNGITGFEYTADFFKEDVGSISDPINAEDFSFSFHFDNDIDSNISYKKEGDDITTSIQIIFTTTTLQNKQSYENIEEESTNNEMTNNQKLCKFLDSFQDNVHSNWISTYVTKNPSGTAIEKAPGLEGDIKDENIFKWLEGKSLITVNVNDTDYLLYYEIESGDGIKMGSLLDDKQFIDCFSSNSPYSLSNLIIYDTDTNQYKIKVWYFNGFEIGSQELDVPVTSIEFLDYGETSLETSRIYNVTASENGNDIRCLLFNSGTIGNNNKRYFNFVSSELVDLLGYGSELQYLELNQMYLYDTYNNEGKLRYPPISNLYGTNVLKRCADVIYDYGEDKVRYYYKDNNGDIKIERILKNDYKDNNELNNVLFAPTFDTNGDITGITYIFGKINNNEPIPLFEKDVYYEMQSDNVAFKTPYRYQDLKYYNLNLKSTKDSTPQPITFNEINQDSTNQILIFDKDKKFLCSFKDYDFLVSDCYNKKLKLLIDPIDYDLPVLSYNTRDGFTFIDNNYKLKYYNLAFIKDDDISLLQSIERLGTGDEYNLYKFISTGNNLVMVQLEISNLEADVYRGKVYFDEAAGFNNNDAPSEGRKPFYINFVIKYNKTEGENIICDLYSIYSDDKYKKIGDVKCSLDSSNSKLTLYKEDGNYVQFCIEIDGIVTFLNSYELINCYDKLAIVPPNTYLYPNSNNDSLIYSQRKFYTYYEIMAVYECKEEHNFNSVPFLSLYTNNVFTPNVDYDDFLEKFKNNLSYFTFSDASNKVDVPLNESYTFSGNYDYVLLSYLVGNKIFTVIYSHFNKTDYTGPFEITSISYDATKFVNFPEEPSQSDIVDFKDKYSTILNNENMFKITNTSNPDKSILQLDVTIEATESGITMSYTDYGYNHVVNYIEGRTTVQLLKLILYTSS